MRLQFREQQFCDLGRHHRVFHEIQLPVDYCCRDARRHENHGEGQVPPVATAYLHREGDQHDHGTCDRSTPRRNRDQQEQTHHHFENALHPVKAGWITPASEVLADFRWAGEGDPAMRDHHNAKCDRQSDGDEFDYRHRLILSWLSSCFAASLHLARDQQRGGLDEAVEEVERLARLGEAPLSP
jgi:hypothetical protein